MGRPAVKVTLDTNILVRAVVQDDPAQAQAASRLLREAEMLAVPTSCLCEFVWVLARTYKFDRIFIADALRRLLDSPTVRTHRAAAEAGLQVHESGGDFADGVIAYEGRHAGAEAFASFDRNAVRLLQGQGLSAYVPGT
jgi:predicted nucleic-acid-binding protein